MHGSRPPGLLRRLGAMLYDGLLIVAIWMVTLFVVVPIAGSAVVGPVIQSVLFIEMFAFLTYAWVHSGQTLGMLAWRLRIETPEGRTPTLNQALLRFIGGLLSFATLGIGFLWLYLDPGRRAWPDLLSGTFVVHETPARSRAA